MTEGRKKGKQKAAAQTETAAVEEPAFVEPTLESQFAAFVKHGNAKKTENQITLTQIDLWLKHAGVLKVRKLTRTDTGVCYFKFKKYKLNFDEFKEFIEILAQRKQLLSQDIRDKLINCGPPPEDDETKAKK